MIYFFLCETWRLRAAAALEEEEEEEAGGRTQRDERLWPDATIFFRHVSPLASPAFRGVIYLFIPSFFIFSFYFSFHFSFLFFLRNDKSKFWGRFGHKQPT